MIIFAKFLSRDFDPAKIPADSFRIPAPLFPTRFFGSQSNLQVAEILDVSSSKFLMVSRILTGMAAGTPAFGLAVNFNPELLHILI